MKKLAEAADSLLKKGKITQEEHDLLKQAGFTINDSIKSGVNKPIASALVALGGAALLQQLLQPIISGIKVKQSYNKLIEKNPMLAEKDPEEIKDYFNVIKTFSPKAASNPLVAGALVNKMMEFGGVDHKLVQDISNIQEGISQSDALKAFTGAAAKNIMTPGLLEHSTSYEE